MKVAAIQMVTGSRLQDNLEAAQALVAQAADLGAELVVLPENFCLMGRLDSDKLAVREAPGAGAAQAMLSAAARANRLWLVGGTLPMAAGDDAHVRSCCLAFAPDGRQVARYDKIHLFRFDNGRESYDETRVTEAGNSPVAFELTARDGQLWRVGMSICYDLRFPELYRQLGADLLLVPSAFTHVTGQAHWDLLLRARAVENLAYVLAPAQGGTHDNGRTTWGHSMVVDPWGAVLAQREPPGAGVVLAQLDHARLGQLRAQLPALQHRRL